MAIKANDLVMLFQKALREKWGYIWGSAGEMWTEEKQHRATREMTVKYGGQWVGKRVADCSGLFYWAFRELGSYMYHGSNTMWREWCVKRGKLPCKELRVGSAVFKTKGDDRYHVGLYVGGGHVIEAEGTRNGVVESNVDAWSEWGELKGVVYGDDEFFPTLRKGDKGDIVMALQEKLHAFGYAEICGKIDGIFGSGTREAVKVFQKDRRLEVDGVVGQMTWLALEKAVEPVMPAPSVGLLAELKAIIEKYEGVV